VDEEETLVLLEDVLRQSKVQKAKLQRDKMHWQCQLVEEQVDERSDRP
jgi:hypothetical protein